MPLKWPLLSPDPCATLRRKIVADSIAPGTCPGAAALTGADKDKAVKQRTGVRRYANFPSDGARVAKGNLVWSKGSNENACVHIELLSR
jgi:hypothetical protein